MNNQVKNYFAKQRTISVICSVALSFLLGSAGSFAASPEFSLGSQEPLRLGERIYREGVLPSGELLRASVKGGLSVPGTTFACISCHLRSGLGSLDEGVYIPPINSEKLF